MLTLYVMAPDDDNDIFPPQSALSLAAYRQHPPTWVPRVEQTLLMFDAMPLAFNEDINRFGVLSHIVVQLVEVKQRLAHGKFALLRTTFGDPLFLSLASTDGFTKVSLIGTLPAPFFGYFPTPNSPSPTPDVNQAHALYTYVEANWDRLHQKDRDTLIAQAPTKPMRTSELLSAIDAQIALGTEVFNELCGRAQGTPL